MSLTRDTLPRVAFTQTCINIMFNQGTFDKESRYQLTSFVDDYENVILTIEKSKNGNKVYNYKEELSLKFYTGQFKNRGVRPFGASPAKVEGNKIIVPKSTMKPVKVYPRRRYKKEFLPGYFDKSSLSEVDFSKLKTSVEYVNFAKSKLGNGIVISVENGVLRVLFEF